MDSRFPRQYPKSKGRVVDQSLNLPFIASEGVWTLSPPLQIQLLFFTNNNNIPMSRPCAILFITIATLSCLGAIAVTVVAYYTCAFMSPYNVNCAYLGYYKLCCTGCQAYSRCTPYAYNAGAIVAQAALWLGFVVFAALGHCMARRARYNQMDGMGGVQMNMTGAPMVAYGTPVYGNGY